MQGIQHSADIGSYRYLMVAQHLSFIQRNQNKSRERYVSLRALVATLWMQNHAQDPLAYWRHLSQPFLPDLAKLAGAQLWAG